MLPEWVLGVWLLIWWPVVFVWFWSCQAWVTQKMGRDNKPIRFFVRLKWEVHPFIPVGIFVDLVLFPLVEGEPNKWWFYLVAATALWSWFKNDDDDDRWKRRRKKLADKVSVTGGKLVVVPEGGRA